MLFDYNLIFGEKFILYCKNIQFFLLLNLQHIVLKNKFNFYNLNNLKNLQKLNKFEIIAKFRNINYFDNKYKLLVSNCSTIDNSQNIDIISFNTLSKYFFTIKN